MVKVTHQYLVKKISSKDGGLPPKHISASVDRLLDVLAEEEVVANFDPEGVPINSVREYLDGIIKARARKIRANLLYEYLKTGQPE